MIIHKILKMENFDIEKLEKKNIFTTPPDFYREVQQNVFNKIDTSSQTSSSQTKYFKLFVKYAVAAVVVLCLGFIAFYQLGKEGINKKSENPILTQQTDNTLLKTEQTPPSEQVQPPITAPESTIANTETPKRSETSTHSIVTKSKTAVVSPKVESSSEQQMKALIYSFSNTELADLSKGSEQDIYLDLFN